MALQDLTPQLRTRLNRMERAVGWFVFLATLLLAFGFAHYIYNTARSKGWFFTKAPFFTFTDRATGLKVGDPVILMGLPVGQITKIEPMEPYHRYEIYVEFELKDPYYGYIWTVGSRAKVATADLLGKRVVEVTKGTNGYPVYIFNPLRNVSITEAQNLPDLDQWRLAEDVYGTGTNELEVIAAAFEPLTNLTTIAATGKNDIWVMDLREKKNYITGVWHDRAGHYEHFDRVNQTNKYWLLSDESPAVTERLEQFVNKVEDALPNILGLTNQVSLVLSNAANLTSNYNELASAARVGVTNISEIAAQLRGPGTLGEWMLGTNGYQQLSQTIESANTAISRADTNVAALIEQLGLSVSNLAEITGELRIQVEANTNLLDSISKAVIDTDDLVQGLKRHWLLRSAFRNREQEQERDRSDDRQAPVLTTPKGREQFPKQ